MCKLLAALLVACVPAATATGAFGSLWVIDLRRAVEPMWPGYELFTVDHPMSSSYGQNEFAMIASHASQYWFEVYGLWVDDPDAIDDVSDVYVAKNRGHRTPQVHWLCEFSLAHCEANAYVCIGCDAVA